MPYYRGMDDQPTTQPPRDWIEALVMSEKYLAAGRVMPGDAVRHRIRDSIKRLEAGLETETAARG